MVTADLKYIVIFEISTNVPVYEPCFERLENEFLGTFTLADNAFADRCGLEIGTTGTIHSILQLTASDNKKVKKKQYGMPGATPDPDNCRETQTDPTPELRSADCNLQTQMMAMPGSVILPAASSIAGSYSA